MSDLQQKSFIRKAFDFVTKVVFFATVITAVTPTTVDNEYLQKGLKIINFCAGNFGHNINADDPSLAPQPEPEETTTPVEKTSW